MNSAKYGVTAQEAYEAYVALDIGLPAVDRHAGDPTREVG